MSHSRKAENPDQINLPADSGPGDFVPENAEDLAHVLERVISATKADSKRSECDVALRRKLIAVATQFSGQELVLDPILVSLVDAVTGVIRPLTADQRSVMCRAVARTLYDDSESRARLERLWHSLGASTE